MSFRIKHSNTAIVAIGSNMGDKMENSRKGISALDASGKIKVLSRSGFYLTEPVGYADQPWFINCAVMVETELTPRSLLQFLKKLEHDLGRRVGGIRNGPRVLDFDIIFYSDWVIESAELIIPHPRMQDRGFVLKPLCDIAVDWVHPIFQKTVGRLLAEMDAQHEECISVAGLSN
ncbi:MAG: 2-amino-4-hydroxy-6-hydroxymethyldihydropteridine diphosphokinase [Desulfobacterales bacterium]